MITDKQFNDAFTAAGGWFILTQIDEIINWTGTKASLKEYMFTKGFDSKITGTNVRVSSTLRIIQNDRVYDALEKIRTSRSINARHPEAAALAENLIKKYNLE